MIRTSLYLLIAAVLVGGCSNRAEKDNQQKGGKNMDAQRFRNPNMKLAHAYIPFQYYSNKYSLEEVLQKGTLFPELWMPYQRHYR